jgi:hypothetical protein
MDHVQAIANRLELSTEDLFDKAYIDCRGYLWGIHGPIRQHQLWKKGGTLPQYVLTFVRERGVDSLH